MATAPKLGDLQLSQHRPEATGHSDPGSPGTHTPHSANKSEPAQKGLAQPPRGRGAPRGERRITVCPETFLLSSTDTFRSDADPPTVDKGQRRVWLSPSSAPGDSGVGRPGVGPRPRPGGTRDANARPRKAQKPAAVVRAAGDVDPAAPLPLSARDQGPDPANPGLAQHPCRRDLVTATRSSSAPPRHPCKEHTRASRLP